MSDNINNSENQYVVIGGEDTQETTGASSLFVISNPTITCPSESSMEEKMGKCEEKLKQTDKMMLSICSSLNDIRRIFFDQIQDVVQTTIEQLSSGDKRIGVHNQNEQETIEHIENEIEQLKKLMADMETNMGNMKMSSSEEHGGNETTQQDNALIHDLHVEIASLKSENEELMEAKTALERQIKELEKRHEDDSSEMKERISALEQAIFENAGIDRRWDGNEDQITEETIQHQNEQREGSRSPENRSFISRILPNFPWNGNQS